MIIDEIINIIRNTTKEFEMILKVTSAVAKYLDAKKVRFLIEENKVPETAPLEGVVMPVEIIDNRIKNAWQIIGGPKELKGEIKTQLLVIGYLLILGMENIKLRGQAIVDSLTKLYNRTYFDIRIREEIEKSKRYETPFSLLMIDIDHFKSFNDVFGHLAGDEVLRIVGRVLRDNTRSSDLIFRYGGEEFAIFLPNLTKENAMKVAERIKQHIDATIETADRLRIIIKKNPLVKDGRSIPISVSIGVSAFGGANKALTLSDIVMKADESLYRAKETGRDRVEVVGRSETLRILIVDDEVGYTDLLKDYFSSRGYVVTTANSGDKALELLSHRMFDIMLLDIRMPGITGLDVLERIPKLIKKMKVIVLTVVADAEIKRIIYEYGACEYLQKPISIEYLDKHLMAQILEMKA